MCLLLKGLLTPRDYGFLFSKNRVIEEILKFFFLVNICYFPWYWRNHNNIFKFFLFRLQKWLDQCVYITTNHNCCLLNCSSVPAESPICRSPNTLFSCSTSTSPSAATTSMPGRKQLGAWPGLPAARPCLTPPFQIKRAVLRHRKSMVSRRKCSL